MSASITPTRCPACASATARFAATVDLPTPPLPDEIARILPEVGMLAPACGGGGTLGGAARRRRAVRSARRRPGRIVHR